jgi:hypothetical protein
MYMFVTVRALSVQAFPLKQVGNQIMLQPGSGPYEAKNGVLKVLSVEQQWPTFLSSDHN